MKPKDTLRRFTPFQDAIILKALEVYMLAITDAAKQTSTLGINQHDLITTLNGIEHLKLLIQNDSIPLKKPFRGVQVTFKPGDLEIKP